MTPPPQVLIVDDDAPTRTLFRAVLERQGLSVVHAVDGDEALGLLESRSFDAVLLDLLMPGTDGAAVLRQLLVRTPELVPRVVVATAASAAQLEETPELRHVAAVLTKPLEIQRLASEVLACVAASIVERDVRVAHGNAELTN